MRSPPWDYFGHMKVDGIYGTDRNVSKIYAFHGQERAYMCQNRTSPEMV